jgi:L-lysine 2,3-aminomutase
VRVGYAKIVKFAWTKGGSMGVTDIIASVDREIALLQQARALLSGVAVAAPKKKAGRPKKAPVPPKSTKKVAKKKRNLSPEGRKRIAEAVRRRWEAQKKAAPSK